MSPESVKSTACVGQYIKKIGQENLHMTYAKLLENSMRSNLGELARQGLGRN